MPVSGIPILMIYRNRWHLTLELEILNRKFERTFSAKKLEESNEI
jgi:hypothetical protein